MLTKPKPALRKIDEAANAIAPTIGKIISPLRHWPTAGLTIDRITTPPMTRRVPMMFCRAHTSPKRITAKTEAKIGEEFTIGTERATPTLSIPR